MRRAVIVGPRQKRALYITTALVWISGVLWLYFRYFGRVQTEFGLEPHPGQALCLEIHGAAAMLFLFLFGTFLPNHIRFGWRHDDQRPSGLFLITVSVFLILTGWGLYYIGDESFRRLTSGLHSIVGALLPAVLFLHIWLARHRAKSENPPPPPHP